MVSVPFRHRACPSSEDGTLVVSAGMTSEVENPTPDAMLWVTVRLGLTGCVMWRSPQAV
jgi:hypothetical protein